MEKDQEVNQDTLPTNNSPEPVSHHALSKCLAHSDPQPEITPLPQNNSTESSPNPTPRPKNLFKEPAATDDTVLVDGILPFNSRNTTIKSCKELSRNKPLTCFSRIPATTGKGEMYLQYR